MQTSQRRSTTCNRIFLADIAATDRAVHDVMNGHVSKPIIVIPVHDRNKLKGRVQRAVDRLQASQRRRMAIEESLRLYSSPADVIITRYFRLLRTRSRFEQREKLMAMYSDLLYRTLDVELLEEVRNKLCEGNIPLAETPSRVGSGSIAARLDAEVSQRSGFTTTICDVCGNDSDFVTDRNEQMTCNVCYVVIDQLSDIRKHHPLSNAFTIADRLAPFKEILRRYQGQRTANISVDVIEVVRGVLNDKGISVQKASRQNVMDCLVESRKSACYKDAVTIHSIVTGQPIDTIHHLEEILLDDFNTLLEEHDALHREAQVDEVRNFEHLQFLLYLLLVKNGHECKCEDIPTTTNFVVVSSTYDVYAILFKRLGWVYAM